MKALLVALLFAIVAPACLVHTSEPGYEVRRSAYSTPVRRCHPSRYWNGERCARKGQGHYKHAHHHHGD